MTSRSALLVAATACAAALAGGCRHGAKLPPPVTLASDTIRLGSNIEGDLHLRRSIVSCFAEDIYWTWTLTEVRLSGVGRKLRLGGCPPRHFRATIGTLGPFIRPDEAWVPTYYAVVACRPDGTTWRRVIVLSVPQSRIEARYGGRPMVPASEESYARATGDSARQADRAYCATKRR